MTGIINHSMSHPFPLETSSLSPENWLLCETPRTRLFLLKAVGSKVRNRVHEMQKKYNYSSDEVGKYIETR